MAWLPAVLVLLATGSLTAPAATASDGDGVLSVRLDQAVPFAAEGLPRGDLDIVLDVAFEDGRAAPAAWAHLPALPAAEHPARVQAAQMTEGGWHLEVEVRVRDVLPLTTGGTARFRVDLERHGTRIHGTYRGDATGLSDAEGLALWRERGGRGRPAFRGGLKSGTTRSVTRLPARYYGVGGTVGQPVRASATWQAPRPDVADDLARPRLLFGADAADALVARAAEGLPGAYLDRTRALLAGDAGLVLVASAGRYTGRAAGWAMVHRLSGAAGDAARSAELARRALDAAETAAGRSRAAGDLAVDPPLDAARRLAGLAVAYDLAAEAWPEDLAADVRMHLATWAVRVGGQGPHVTLDEAAYGADRLLGEPAGPYDLRLATVRAAAGLAALAVWGEALPEAAGLSRDDVRAGLAVARRTVRRFLRTAFGDEGAGTGQHGLGDAMEIVGPFVAAWRRVTGEDMAAGTGAARAARWGIATWGRDATSDGAAPCGGWLVAGLPLAPPEHKALVRNYLATTGWTPATPWQGVLGVAFAPAGDASPDGPAQEGLLPPAALDRHAGACVLRGGRDPGRDAMLVFRGAGGVPAAAGARGHVSLTALGRTWVSALGGADGDAFAWPAAARANCLRIHESLLNDRRAAVPTGPGRLTRVQARRDGAGSVGMLAHGFREVRPGRLGGGLEDAQAWRTVGFDASGASGAAAVVVTVGGAVGLADRQRVWEMEVGPVAADRVTVDGRRFVVRPAGSAATLVGTMVYPPSGHIEYVPPAGGRGGRVRCHMTKPTPSNQQLLERSLEEAAEAIERMTRDAGGGDDAEPDPDAEIDLTFILEEPDPDREARLQEEGKTVLNKLYRHTSSIKMGGGDRFPKAASSCIVVLTVQDGPAPEVTVLGADDEALLRVGPLRVRYEEYLLTFEETP